MKIEMQLTGPAEAANAAPLGCRQRPKPTSRRGLAILLAALSAVGPFSIDAYLPSFREIGQQLDASAWLVQQTLTAYLVAFAAMTLWHGVLSDAFGRRRVTLVLVAGFTFASIGCMLAGSIEALILFRAAQGMCAGAGVVIGRAIVRDLFEGAEARRLMSTIAAVFAIAPALAPIIGGWLQVWLGWRSVFAFLALFAAALWYSVAKFLPETLAPAARQPLRVGSVLRGYGQALVNARFLGLIAALAFSFTAVFVYISSAPKFLLEVLQKEETDFFWLFGPITAGLLLGNAMTARIAAQWSNRKTLVVAYTLMSAAVGWNVVFHFFVPPSLPWSVLPLVLYVFGNAMAAPSLTLMALDLMPRTRGLASSCQGFLQTSSNVLAAGLIAPFFWDSALRLSLGMAILFAGAALACVLSARRSG